MLDLLTTNDPRDVAKVLHQLASIYRQDQAKLQDDWQDPQAGKVWGDLAKVLESATDKAHAVCDKHGF